jgi:hypothetical protein
MQSLLFNTIHLNLFFRHVILTMKGEFSLQIQAKKFQNKEEKDDTPAERESEPHISSGPTESDRLVR